MWNCVFSRIPCYCKCIFVMEGYHEIDGLNDRLRNESLETEENASEEISTGPRITGKNF